MKKNYSAPRVQVIKVDQANTICMSYGGDGNGRPASAPRLYRDEWEDDEDGTLDY